MSQLYGYSFEGVQTAQEKVAENKYSTGDATPFGGVMSRPKPAILLSRIDPKTFKAEQVLKANAIYAVFLDGQPINLRSLHTAIDIGPKYKKVSFSNPGHAFNLAEKLNKLFRTDRFGVFKLSQGTPLDECSDD